MLTAWQALIDTLRVGEGDRVLIHAASGGVGRLAVQIAEARGAEVWGAASAASHETLRALGLDHRTDYRSKRFEELSPTWTPCSIWSGDENPIRSVQSLRRGGQLVVIPSPTDVPPQQVLEEADVNASWMLVEPDYAALEADCPASRRGDAEGHRLRHPSACEGGRAARHRRGGWPARKARRGRQLRVSLSLQPGW